MNLTFWMVGDWPKVVVYVTLILCLTYTLMVFRSDR